LECRCSGESVGDMTDTWEDEGGTLEEDFPYDDEYEVEDDSDWDDLDEIDDYEYVEEY